jgi:hypothetical protein
VVATLAGRRGRGEDLDDLVDGQRGRLLRRRADEPGDAGSVADRAPGLVGQVHPDQDVTGVDLALHLLALAVLDLGDLFGRHLDLEDVLLHVQRLDPGLEVGLDLVLVAGIGVHDVPLAVRSLQCRAKFLGGIDLGGLLISGFRGGSPSGGLGGLGCLLDLHEFLGLDQRLGGVHHFFFFGEFLGLDQRLGGLDHLVRVLGLVGQLLRLFDDVGLRGPLGR